MVLMIMSCVRLACNYGVQKQEQTTKSHRSQLEDLQTVVARWTPVLALSLRNRLMSRPLQSQGAATQHRTSLPSSSRYVSCEMYIVEQRRWFGSNSVRVVRV